MTDTQKQQHVCWLILLCLSMPVWHPARTTRLPQLAHELAAYAARRPSLLS